MLEAQQGICHAAGYSTNIKKLLTSEGNRRADLEILNIRVAQQMVEYLVEYLVWTKIPARSSSSDIATQFFSDSNHSIAPSSASRALRL